MNLPLKLFAATAAVQVAAVATDLSIVHWITAPLLAPLLAWHIWRSRRKPDAVVHGLGLITLGDIALLVPHRAGLLAAMTFTFAALISFTLAFLNRARPRPAPSAMFALLGVSTNALFGDRMGALRVPLLLYGLALTAMAAAAAGVSPLVAAGGTLFLIADVLTGLGVAGLGPAATVTETATAAAVATVAVATHAAALALIATGWTRPRDAGRSERSGVEQTVRRSRSWAGHDARGGVADDGAVYLGG